MVMKQVPILRKGEDDAVKTKICKQTSISEVVSKAMDYQVFS
jgi:hypothetical protein